MPELAPRPYQPQYTSSGQLPISLEEMPTPKDVPVNVPPSAYDKNAYVDQPPGAGYMGTTGKVADIATNFLHGWLRGKAYAQQRLIQQADNEVRGSKSAFDIAQSAYNNFIQNPELQQKYPQQFESTKAAMMHSWQGYLGVMEKYANPAGAPGPNGQPTDKKPGIGGRLKQAMVPTTPQLYSQAALSVLRSMDPSAMIQQTAGGKTAAATASGAQTGAEVAAKTAPSVVSQAQSAATVAGTQATTAVEGQGLRKRFDDVTKEYNDLQKQNPNDPKLRAIDAELHTLQAQAKSRGIQLATPGEIQIGHQQEELAQGLNEAKLSGMEKMKNGQMAALNPLEREALAQSPRDTWSAYMQQVGPNMRFADTFTAARQFMKDQADMYKTMYQGRGVWGQNWEYTEQNIRAQHPDWDDTQVAQATIAEMEKLRGARGGAAGGAGAKFNPTEIPALRANLFAQVVFEHPEYKDFFSYEVKDKAGNPQTVYGFNPNAGPAKTGWFGHEDQQTFENRKKQAQQAVVDTATKLGYTADQVKQVTGGLLGGGAPATQSSTQPNGAPNPQAGAGRWYMVTDPQGQSKRMWIADNQIQAVQAGAPQGSKIVAEPGGTH